MNAGARLFFRDTAPAILGLVNAGPLATIEIPTPGALEDHELRRGYGSALQRFCRAVGLEVFSIAYPERIDIFEGDPVIDPTPTFPRIVLRFSLPKDTE